MTYQLQQKTEAVSRGLSPATDPGGGLLHVLDGFVVALLGFLVSLLLGSNCLGNVSLLLSETIKLILGYNLQRRQWLENDRAESKTLQIPIFAGNNQLTCSLLTIKFNDLINDCLVIKSCALGSLHSLGIATYQMYD